MIKSISLNIILISTIVYSYGQGKELNSFPEVGKKCPDFFFENIQYYTKKNISLDDFRGKWLILDFWSKHCTSCVNSFSKINSLQKEFFKDLQFIMVGLQDRENQIQNIYARYRDKLQLLMPCIYDSIIFKRFEINTAPYLIIIDTEGIVRGLTFQLTSSNIRDFLLGRQPKIENAFRIHQEEEQIHYNRNHPLLINGNGGGDSSYIFRSLLTQWTPLIPASEPHEINKETLEAGRFETLRTSVSTLYMFAYAGIDHWYFSDSLYGSFYSSPVWEVKDSTKFQADLVTGKNYYCYSLTVPKSKANKQFMMQAMQRDLKNYFGYNVSIETRKMPYWKLVSTEDAKVRLRTKGEPTFWNGNLVQLVAKNIPISSLLRLFVNNQSTYDPPFIDETGIQSNIDINANWLLTNIEEIRKGLKVNGLDLIRGEKEMKVIVIGE